MRWVAVVVLLLLVLAAWVAGVLLPDLKWIAIAVTVIAFFSIVALFAGSWIHTRVKAAALEREILKRDAAAKDPEKRPAIVSLRADMRRAIEALKKGPLGTRGRSSLYALPWYVIVGPSTVGKTTALARSGLSFIASDAGTPKLRGTANTRNCEWWFSHEAILLDTAGRFATDDDDHDEWMAFVDSLRRLRPERPLDGLLVAVSVPDILSSGDADRAALATKLRARLDEVLDRLETVVPVYLLLTKTDLVAGFVEFWSDLGTAQRAQVWGASFDIDDGRLSEPGRAIEAELDVLGQSLHSRLLDRLPSERSPERRARVLQFPAEFRALRAPLASFVETLCRPDARQQKPQLRGFYLTSGTQVGRPVERVIAGMLRGFELGSARPPGHEPETQSYFLTDVFRSVIFPDRHLARHSAKGADRRARRELRLGLGAVGAMVALLLPAIVSYVQNTRLAYAVDQAAADFESVGPTSIPGSLEDPVERALDTLDRLAIEAKGFGIPGWFGPRTARDLEPPLRRAYVQRLDSVLRSRVGRRLEKDAYAISKAVRLDDSTATPDDHTPLRAAYDTVDLSVMLSDPRDHADLTWAPPRLARLWKETLEGETTAADDRLVRHAREYLRALQEIPDLAWPVGPGLRAAAAHLKELDVLRLPYDWLVRRAFGQAPLLASDFADSASLKFLTCPADKVLVGGEYVTSGWRKIQAALDSTDPWPADAMVAPWVVADPRIPDHEVDLRVLVRKEYFDRYSAEWMTLLGRCAVTRPSDFASAKDELTALKDPKGFYGTLFSQFKSNAIADEKPEIAPPPLSTEGCASRVPWLKPDASAPSDANALSPVQKSFHPLLVFSGDIEGKAGVDAPLKKYEAILETLRAVLDSAGELRGSELQAQFATAKRGVEGLLDGIEEPTKGRLKQLLMPPVEGTARVGTSQGVHSASDDWKTTVWDALHTELIDHFPFNSGIHVREAANFDQFVSFFQPDGILWGFVHTRLADWIEPGAHGYVVKPGADALGGDLLTCLSVAQEITDAFFVPGEDRGMKLSVHADWSSPDVTEAKFWIGGKATPLPKGEWSPTLKWAGEDARLDWTQSGHVTQQIGRHAFSLFDLFQQLGGLKPGGSRGLYVVEFPPLTLKIRSDGREDALRADFFSRLHCPADIHMGAN